MRSRLTAAIAGGALAATAAGGLTYTSLDKSIDLSVDGKASAVHAFGSTVRDVLTSEDISVGEHDLVSPALTSSVHDGSDIVVRYGRKLTLTTDGRTVEHWTTARTVDEALSQLGLRDADAKLSVSRSMPLGRSGLDVRAATRKQVTLDVGGAKARRTTYAATVAQLLTEARVRIGGLDRLSVRGGTPLTTGATVTLTRVAHKKVAKSKAVPFTVTRTTSKKLAKGRTRIERHGKAGALRLEYVDTYVNGKRTDRKATSRTLVRRPVTEILVVGTKPKPKPQPKPQPQLTPKTVRRSQGSTAIPRSGGLNWASLARCESGGNPRAVNPNGHYGLYQFSLQTWAGVGGSGNPVNASVAEQTRRAQILYDRAGAGQWSCGRHLFD